ncbi:MAG: hypothetical protein K2H18_02740, partial [Muribaculaceae bacterium]|nr:hypothetical protein [Muribaculaceae bacterium]
MKYLTLLSCPLIAFSAAAFHAPAPGAVSTEGNTTLISTAKGTVMITPVTSDIFRISQIPAGVSHLDLPKSQSAILPEQNVPVNSFITESDFIIS